MQVTLAFRKFDGSIEDRLIRYWTGSEYTHVEIIIKDKWISSGPNHGGVYIRDLGPLKDEWDYVNVEVDEMYLNQVMEFIESQQDKKYDWIGILWAQFFNITRKHNQDEWFCSELVAEILLRFNNERIYHSSASYSPVELYEIYT